MDVKNIYSIGASIPLKVRVDPARIKDHLVAVEIEDPQGKLTDVKMKSGFRFLIEGDYRVTYKVTGTLNTGEPFQRAINHEFHVEKSDDNILMIPDIGMVLRWIPPGTFSTGACIHTM